MMAAYSQHPNQLQHSGMQQGPQQHIQGHPGQPAPHTMQQLHPQQQAQVYAQQQHQMALGIHPGQAQMAQIQQQQQLLVQAQQRQRAQQQQHAMMNGINVGAGNPGMIFQGQNNGSPQVRGLPNGLYAGGPPGGVPGANMGGYGAGNPQMRGNVNLSPHIQQQLQQAHQQQAQQQAQQQQQQQQQMVAQQLAMNHANAANAQASPMGMASHPQMSMQSGLAQQQAVLVAQARAQQQAQQQPQSLRGASVLKLHQFCSHLAAFETTRQANDINHWRRFVQEFYSPGGVMRQALWNSTTRETKQFEITTQVLARYYFTLFESGIRNVQIMLENTRETVLPNQGHIVDSPKTSFIYWFENGCHLVATGALKATFNPNSQMEALDFQTCEHADYVPRSIVNQLISANEDAQIKSSPGSKLLGKRPSQRHVVIPDNPVSPYGVPTTVFRCLEIAETISQMRDLFNFSHANAQLTPQQALQAIVIQQQQQQQQQQQLAQQHAQHAQHAAMQQHAMQQQQQQQQQQAAHANAVAQSMQSQQGHPGGPGGPGMPHGPGQQHPVMAGGLPIGLTRSPSANEIRMGVPPSPHLSVGGVGGGGPGTAPSPAQNHIQAPGLVKQHSQQGHPTSNPSSQTSTTVGSANTSPNQTNKRRRASTTSEVKQDDLGDGIGVSGNANNKIKQSPRVGGNKRLKTNS